jgi:two-component system, OmpR family, phosphate regulon sensor histidine kinase PhoR
LETERMPLANLVEDARVVCAHAAEEKNITIEVLCPQDIEVNASPTLLEQAFVNLLDNAIKYSGINSTVRMEAMRNETAVVVRVIDRGCGIPAKDLPRIFERFYRVDKARSREEGGTGLGLSIVKHVVALHGGSVAAESREGIGSTFTISLPTEQAEVVST